MSTVKLGLIGCGRISRLVHLDVLVRLPDAELIAVAEADPGRRAEAARAAPRARVYAGYPELLADPDVDAVVIALPNALHAAAAVAALRAGKHVYIEKPLATDLKDAQRVFDAWTASGRVAMVGYNFRFNPLHVAAKECIRSGRLGRIVGVRSSFSTPPSAAAVWKHTRSDGGGVLLDLASHHIDLIRFLFDDDIGEVFATVDSRLHEDDTAAVTFLLASGPVVTSFFSLDSIEEDRFEIYGEERKLTIDRYHALNVQISEGAAALSRLARLKRGLDSLRSSPNLAQRLLAPTNEPSYRNALAHFVEAVGANRPARPDVGDGYRCLAVIAAAEESARTGRMVPVAGCAPDAWSSCRQREPWPPTSRAGTRAWEPRLDP